MNPPDHHVEDVIRGVRAIAKALRATFLSGRTLCARWIDLAEWLERQERR